jgi:hypothetical protein
MLGLNSTKSASGTTFVYFEMKERCANYPSLVDLCIETPAPDPHAPTLTDDASDTIDTLRPYIGLKPENGGWFFQDNIEYRKDPYTIQLKVRYSHDLKAADRKHVVMMDRWSSKIVTYDEVTTNTDPKNTFNTFSTPQVFVTNYKVEDSMANEVRIVCICVCCLNCMHS